MMKQRFSYLFPRVFPQLSGGPGVTMTPSYELKKVNNEVWGSFRKIWGSKPSKIQRNKISMFFQHHDYDHIKPFPNDKFWTLPNWKSLQMTISKR